MMKTAGIIAEYNPFHMGHRYHIEKTREMTGADYVIVVMSGNFVQRGEPACTDKYFRTRMALCGGADLVMELPAVYATASAEQFAQAGVTILDKLGCVDYLSFGSEWAELPDYQPYVKLFTKENERYRDLLQTFLRQGDSFPAARSKAAMILFSEEKSSQESSGPPTDTKIAADTSIETTITDRTICNTDSFLKEPNQILGLEYLKALERTGSGIRPVVIRRSGSGYNEIHIKEGYPSAAAIRSEINSWLSKDTDCDKDFQQKMEHALGAETDAFLHHIRQGEYASWEDLMPFLDYELMMSDRGTAEDRMSWDDLTRRIRQYYRTGSTIEELVSLIHARNRTDSAVRRALLHILLRIDHSRQNLMDYYGIPYARVLGFRKSAAPLLKKIREKGSIPLIQRVSEGLFLFPERNPDRHLYETDLKTAFLYEYVAAGRSGRAAVRELQRQQVII